MRLTPATEWDFASFVTQTDERQAQTIRQWMRGADPLIGLLYTDAFLEAQAQSNGELFEVDELSVEKIELDDVYRRVKVQFQFSASAFDERVDHGGKLPIHGRATLVIYEDGSEQLERVTANVVTPETPTSEPVPNAPRI